VCLAAAAIVFALGMHIWRMAGMAFTNSDDMLMGLTVDRMRTEGWWRSYYELANVYALWQGRVYFYFSMFFFVAPFLIRSLALRAAISGLLQLGVTASVSAVVGLYAGWTNALLFAALACAWLPYWATVSPINGFPFVYHLPVILFFAALAVWILRARRQRTAWGGRIFWGSAFFVSLFFYEALIPPFFVIAMIAVAVETRRTYGGWNRAALMRACVPWLAGFALWAGIYMGFRRLHPPTYGGSALAGVGRGELDAAASALFYFEGYSLPGANWFGNLHYNTQRLWGSPQTIGYGHFFLRNLTADGIVLALLLIAAMACWAAMVFAAPPRRRVPVGLAAIALACAVMTPLPLAFTSKYRTLATVLTVAPYLPGYYAFLAWCVFGALLFPLAEYALRRRPAARWTAVAMLAGGCAVVSAANAMSNQTIYAAYDELSDKWKTIDLLARTDWFAALPAHAAILAPGLWDNFPSTTWHHGDAYWSAYFSGWAGRPVEVIRIPRRVPDLLRRGTPVFYCEHQWLAGRLDAVMAVEPVTAISPAGEALSDSVLLVARHPLAGMEMEYRTPASDAAGAGPLFARLPEWRHEHGAYLARLRLPDLIAGTARAVDSEEAAPPDPLLEFGRGFSSGAEHDANGQYWRWSDGADGEGELNLFNPSPRPVTVRFRAGLRFDPRQKSAVFDVAGPWGTETFTAAAGETVERVWHLAPGANRVRMKCHAGRMPAPGDARYIVFGIWNWTLTPVQESR